MWKRNLSFLTFILFTTFSVSAETFEEIVSDAKFLSVGKCTDKEGTFNCLLFRKNDTDYLLYRSKDGKPYRIIVKNTGLVIWVAEPGMEV